MAKDTYVPRTSKDEDESHRLDAERTAWESSREHDSGTGSPQAKGEKSSTDAPADETEATPSEPEAPTGV
jgi:hypothetical protein